MFDDWLADRPADLRSPLMFTWRGRKVSKHRVDAAVAKAASDAGIDHVTPHQLRHTLATQAINRGMSLEAIAALLGHRSMRMTMVLRIADRTVADEYFAVSEKVEALYNQPRHLPSGAVRMCLIPFSRQILSNSTSPVPGPNRPVKTLPLSVNTSCGTPKARIALVNASHTGRAVARSTTCVEMMNRE